MICPHCNKGIHEHFDSEEIGKDESGDWSTLSMNCPECKQIIIKLLNKHYDKHGILRGPQRIESLVHPKKSNFPSAPQEVSQTIAQDYNEACLVFNDSPRASAALSRRCLQALLIETHPEEKTELSHLIDIAMQELPPYLAQDIDAIRNIGNFAAHPNKNLETDEILDVEPNEAEWNLEVLQGLFDFYYVQKKRSEERRAKLNEKLEASGKPPMK